MKNERVAQDFHMNRKQTNQNEQKQNIKMQNQHTNNTLSH